MQLLNFRFDHDSFGGMDWSLRLSHGDDIGPCVDVVFHNGWIQPKNFSVGPDKDVTELCANANGTLFFIHKNKIRNPSGVRNGVDEAGSARLLYLRFHRGHFGRVNGLLTLVYWGHIRPSVDVVFHNGWI